MRAAPPAGRARPAAAGARGRARGRADRAGRGARGSASARSRSSCARAATARCAAWSRRSATRSSPCAGSASARSSSATWPRARRAASPTERDRRSRSGEDARTVSSGKMPAVSEERLFAVRGAVQAEANEADAILAATEELMRELLERNELGAGGDGQLPVHDHRRPRRRVPGRRRPQPRARRGAAALLPRDPRARLDAAGDPGDGPLLRAGRPRRRPTPTWARRRSCAPTSTPPSSRRASRHNRSP